MGDGIGRYRGTESRLPQWLRRRPKRVARPTTGTTARSCSWPSPPPGCSLAPAAYPVGYSCSCERIGCPTPARHPVSFAWQTQSTTDRGQIERWARNEPRANFVTATGMVHDVLDVPLAAGRAALERLSPRASRSARSPSPPPRPRTAAGCSSSPPPGARPRTRTSGGPVSSTATRRPWTSTRGSAGTAAAATSSSPGPAPRRRGRPPGRRLGARPRAPAARPAEPPGDPPGRLRPPRGRARGGRRRRARGPRDRLAADPLTR